MLSEMLAQEYCVRAANSGERALAIVHGEPKPDLILLDVKMKGVDGYQVLSALKNDDEVASIPVIFVTGLDAAEDEQKGLMLGAVDYIQKPVTPCILRARVKTHLMLSEAKEVLKDNNEFLKKEIAKRMHENQLIQDVTIRALAHLAETRDPETGSHILRTQNYVNLLAKGIQDHPRFRHLVNEEFIDLVTKSAPLHDIGKVGIPDHVLLKPGKLTPAEWEIMKTHTLLGAEAIELSEADVKHSIEFLKLAKEVARSHHEHWNGGGYPDGLEGEKIPLSARLMAIADVFDALISRRVYKKSFSYETARNIIEDEKGKQFDPDIAEFFLKNFEEFVKIANQYVDAID